MFSAGAPLRGVVFLRVELVGPRGYNSFLMDKETEMLRDSKKILKLAQIHKAGKYKSYHSCPNSLVCSLHYVAPQFK